MQNIDVMANPGATFPALTTEGYSISFVLHTASMSSQGNTTNGTAWYDSNINGFFLGVCVGQLSDGNMTVGPDQNVSVSFPVTVDPLYSPVSSGGHENVLWLEWPNPVELSYNIVWMDQSSMNLGCSANSELITCSSTVSGIYGAPSGPLGTPSGNVNFTSGSSFLGSCALEGSGDSSSCSLSIAASNNGSININASYGGDTFHTGSSNSTTINCCVQTTTSTTSSTSSSSTQSTSSDPSQTTTTSSSDPTSSSHSTTSLRSTSSDNTDSTQPSTHSTFQTTASSSNLGTGGLNYTESMAALVIVAVVITGMMFVTIRKSW